jgi:UTP-glucose-1-phosphate uridylyltransferase
MKLLLLIIVIAAAGYFYMYQSSRCISKEDVFDKSMELIDHINKNKKDLSINKIEAMMSKMVSIKALTDTQEACNAMEDMISEL